MNRATLEELEELFRQLEEMGWNPRLCNTPVPYIFSTNARGALPRRKPGIFILPTLRL